MKLITKRLILRLPAFKDAADIAENINNFVVSRYMAHVPFPYALDDARKFIRLCRKNATQNPPERYEFCIELRSEKKVIGGAGLMKIDHYTGKAEVGYWLGQHYWRQGLGYEAVDALIKFAFTKLKLQRLEAPIYRENRASQALVRKLGFTKEGIRQRASRSRATGKLHDIVVYGLLKEGRRK